MKATRVAVYERGKIFVTSTEGAAAKRYFYSGPSPDGADTLDERITKYESRVAEILQEIHTAAPGSPIPAAEPAELIAHLCVRNAQMRESFTHVAGQVFGRALDTFMDPVKRWTLMGLDKPHPSGVILEEFNKLYDRQLLVLRGIPRERFVRMCFEMTKAKFDPGVPFAGDAVLEFAENFKAGMPNAAANGQRRAMEKTLAPQARIEALQGLTWSIHDTMHDLILPDCIAIDLSEIGECRALAYRPNDALRHVMMPISIRRVLFGVRSTVVPTFEDINVKFAKCSWRFFVTQEEAECFKKLVSEIGTATKEWFDAETSTAIDLNISV